MFTHTPCAAAAVGDTCETLWTARCLPPYAKIWRRPTCNQEPSCYSLTSRRPFSYYDELILINESIIHRDNVWVIQLLQQMNLFDAAISLLWGHIGNINPTVQWTLSTRLFSTSRCSVFLCMHARPCAQFLSNKMCTEHGSLLQS